MRDIATRSKSFIKSDAQFKLNILREVGGFNYLESYSSL